MRLIDLDAGIAPMIDENRKVTVGEFLGIFFEQLPPTIEAIPVEWIMKWSNKRYQETQRDVSIVDVLAAWQKEQEARK